MENEKRVDMCVRDYRLNERKVGLKCKIHSCHKPNASARLNFNSKYAEKNKPPYEANDEKNWTDSESRRNLIKYMCKNMDYALMCVFKDLEDDGDHKNQAFLLGLIIITGVRPGSHGQKIKDDGFI